MTRWWEALRAPEVAKWQHKYRIDSDAGGAQRTVWVILLEMERFKHLAKAFERVSLPVVRAWTTHFNLPRKLLLVLCGYFEHQRRVQFEGRVAEPLQTIMAILPRSKWSCLLLRIVFQDAQVRLPTFVRLRNQRALWNTSQRSRVEVTRSWWSRQKRF